MKFALISDIHSNLEALNSVIDDIEKQKVDSIHCLGDVIGYGSDPIACLEIVNKTCEIKLMGNHEYTALGLATTERYNKAAKAASDWTKNRLSDYELSIISDFEMEKTIDDKFHLVHASPYEPEKWHYIISPNMAMEGFMHFDQQVCFFGHSHLPQIYMEMDNSLPRCQSGHDILPNGDHRYLINVGSVGQPRDNDPRACYVIVDTDEEETEILFRRVEYDIKKTQNKMIEANLPEMLITRLSTGK